MRTSRFIPEGFTVHKETDLGVVYSDGLKAIAYKGRANKPVWYYCFNSAERMAKKVNDLFERLESWEAMKKERRQARKSELDNIKVGDLLYESWGYEQTNVDFYQVVAKKGKTITIRRISSKHHGEAPSGGMSDYVSPVRDAFLEGHEPITKRSLSGVAHGTLSPTNEDKKHFCSWYA